MKITANLVAVTEPVVGVPAETPEELVAYCARVSSNRPKESRHEAAEGLLKYCMKHKHWSIFEMVDAVVEIEAPRDISRQLLRHRSFSFQEFSQRYSNDIQFTGREYRHQDHKNRQNSLDTLTIEESYDCYHLEGSVAGIAADVYRQLCEKGIAKECARVILPEGLTMSTLYMKGSLRSWMHYLDVRDDPGVTQHEHVLLARKIRAALEPAFPTILGLKHD